MRRMLTSIAAIALIAATALAHEGKSHRLLGTVKALHENHLVVTTTQKKDATVMLRADTRYEKDGKPADRSSLVPGTRVSIQLDEKNQEAMAIKIGNTTAAPAH